MLSLKKVSRSFGGITAVDNCSFEIEEGKITSMIGPNGAGKTTLFNIICGLTKMDFGKIFIKNTEISNLQAHKIAKAGISRTFQQAKIFKNMSVRDNLLLAKNCSDAEMINSLKQVHFHLPLETIASDLSYGQQRLLEIARAVLMPHSLLMLDEPTAGVNPKVRHELRHVLLSLRKKGSTILLIEHDMDFVMGISDRVIVLNQGKVLKQGTPYDVAKDKRVLEAYLGK